MLIALALPDGEEEEKGGGGVEVCETVLRPALLGRKFFRENGSGDRASSSVRRRVRASIVSGGGGGSGR